HTRSKRDWSSDVCSSDLFLTQQLMERQRREQAVLKEWDATIAPVLYEAAESEMLTFEQPFEDITPYTKGNRFYKNERSFFEKGRSEERRVGKDGRCRSWQ